MKLDKRKKIYMLTIKKNSNKLINKRVTNRKLNVSI